MNGGPGVRPLPAAGRLPVVVCLRPGIAGPLAQAGLDCEVVDWVRGEEPPPGHRADVCLGGNLADESALAWVADATWVHLTGVGHDNVPDGLLQGRLVTNSPGANAVPVAEFAFAAVLASAKQFPDVWTAGPEASWSDFRLDVLAGRTLGVIGYGHIAQALIARARAFGMTVVVHTRTARSDGDGVRFVSREELASVADYIVVAASANAATYRMVDAGFLARTRPGVRLVNVSRGSLVDQEGLRGFLDSGHVAHASLDTVEPEPLPGDHWLRSHPRVALSPHVAASSPFATQVAVDRFAANFRRYLAGEELHDRVTL